MKQLITSLLLAVSCLCNAQNIWDQAVHHIFTHQGNEREYYLYIPQGLNTRGAPLIISIHGYGGKGYGFYPQLLETAGRAGYAVCIPKGWPDNKGKTGFNVGYPMQQGCKTDDVDFICRLTAFLQKKYGFRKDGTFVTGLSNGGEMCYILAASKPGVFKAYASLAGLQMEWAYRKFTNLKPVPFMEVHGTMDKTSLWEGDPDGKCGWGEYLNVPVAVGAWVHTDRCTHEETVELPLKSEKSNRVILHRFADGTDGCEVRLYEIIGGNHSVGEADMNTSEEVIAFFNKYLN